MIQLMLPRFKSKLNLKVTHRCYILVSKNLTQKIHHPMGNSLVLFPNPFSPPLPADVFKYLRFQPPPQNLSLYIPHL